MHKTTSADYPISPMKNVTSYQSWKAPLIKSDPSIVFNQKKMKKPPKTNTFEEKSLNDLKIKQTTHSKQAIIEDPKQTREEWLNVQKALKKSHQIEIEKIKTAQYALGHQAGIKEGKNQAEKALTLNHEKEAQALGMLLDAFESPLKQCAKKTEEALLSLAFSIAKQIIRRELRNDPEQMIAIIRETLKELPTQSKNIQVFLHPKKASPIKNALSIKANLLSNNSSNNEQRWTLIEDPTMSEDECFIKSEYSEINASIDEQINHLFQQFLKEQRKSSRIIKATPIAEPNE
jgi:flagellar assembly protein FliH